MKRKVAFFLCFTLMLAALSLGLAEDKADFDAIHKIKNEGLNRSQVMEILCYLTDIYGPRLSGSPIKRLAEKWIQYKFKEWGLTNVHAEKFDFGRSWELKRFSAHMIEPVYSPLVAYPKAWTPGTNGAIQAEAVRVDINTEADIEKYRGKLHQLFVLTQPPLAVESHFSPLAHRYTDEELAELARIQDPTQGGQFPQIYPRAVDDKKLKLLKKISDFWVSEGVAAIIEPGSGDGGTILVTGGGDRTPGASKVAPQVIMAVEHYNRICRILERKLRVELEIEIQANYITQDPFDNNIIAELPGTDKKDEIVMLGGHLDSWHAATGATDNAAGCAVAMEAIRILKATGLKPRRTVRIGLWGGEEQGLLGSQAYVSKHFASPSILPANVSEDSGVHQNGSEEMHRKPPAQKSDYARLSGYWNLDNGSGKIRGIYLQGNEEVRPIFEAWLAPFNDMGAITLTIRNNGNTDHLSFDAVGLPGFQFIQDAIDYHTRTHHSNMDVYDRIQKEDLMQAAVIMASFVYHTAMREEMLPRKHLPDPTSPKSSTSLPE